MTSFNTIEFFIPPKRFRFGLSDDEESHSYIQVKLEYTDGDFDFSQEYKEPSSIFSEWLTIIKWLVIDI